MPSPPQSNLLLSKGAMGLRIETDELLGKYREIAQSTDHVANITLTTEQTLTIGEAPLAGGWNAVSSPNTDPVIRAAANAMLAQLPVHHRGLGGVDVALRQVVAGTNYGLTLHLLDGSKMDSAGLA